MIPETPNKPISVTVNPIAGGKFLLRWRYTKINEEVTPTEFRIYIDLGDGFDFNLPDAIIKFGHGGKAEFQWTSDAYMTGQRCKFCVRAFADDKGETQNTDYVSTTADDTGPDAITDIYATVEQLN
jgi:hypothetical protein